MTVSLVQARLSRPPVATYPNQAIVDTTAKPYFTRTGLLDVERAITEARPEDYVGVLILACRRSARNQVRTRRQRARRSYRLHLPRVDVGSPLKGRCSSPRVIPRPFSAAIVEALRRK